MTPLLLYTWVDVALVMETAESAGRLPEWLKNFFTYPDGLLLQILESVDQILVVDLLNELFPSRVTESKSLILESEAGKQRFYDYEIERVANNSAQGLSQRLLKPSFHDIVTRTQPILFPEHLAGEQQQEPGIIAFYSFKGGVGRTTHCLGYLNALNVRGIRNRALIIDADLEAPGISTLAGLESAAVPPTFSFIDFLSLAQTDDSPDFHETISLSAQVIRKQVLTLAANGAYGEHFLLPAFRSEVQAMRLDIRPEHLTSRPGKVWQLTNLFRALGKALDVDAILIDLRAGYSELASPILFDPRVNRILVTTPSTQSLEGTVSVLRQLSKFSLPQGSLALKDPSVIVSFLLPDLLGTEIEEQITDRLFSSYPEDDADPTAPRLRVDFTTFAQELLYASSITDLCRKLGGTSIARCMTSLADDEIAANIAETATPAIGALQTIRTELATLANALEYAETGHGARFLRTAPLRSLARQFSTAIPNAVVIGSKGSGKTYTWLQMIRAKDWSTFTKLLGSAAEQNASIWPCLQSKNLQEAARQLAEECRSLAARELNISSPASSTEVEDKVREALREPGDETLCRHRWFRIIATSMGVDVPMENAAAGLVVERLRQLNQRVVVVFDGLEDLFPELNTNPEQQIALRALIQGVPRQLQEIPDCPLGVLIFVRADLAQSSITQNFGQFSKQYEAFALKWNEEEALRLALWLAVSAGLPLEERLKNSIEHLTAEEATDALVPLWGRKLGSELAREARSADWVIAALSDFKGQIQARDLVRFMRHAAESSRNVSAEDRVFAPRAVRDAITPCSTEKITEITQEIPQLKEIFAILQKSAERKIPFNASTYDLTPEQIRFLGTVGVLIEDRGEYFMPEIFRLGLDFQLAQGARPRVLSLARRARR